MSGDCHHCGEHALDCKCHETFKKIAEEAKRIIESEGADPTFYLCRKFHVRPLIAKAIVQEADRERILRWILFEEEKPKKDGHLFLSDGKRTIIGTYLDKSIYLKSRKAHFRIWKYWRHIIIPKFY